MAVTSFADVGYHRLLRLRLSFGGEFLFAVCQLFQRGVRCCEREGDRQAMVLNVFAETPTMTRNRGDSCERSSESAVGVTGHMSTYTGISKVTGPFNLTDSS